MNDVRLRSRERADRRWSMWAALLLIATGLEMLAAIGVPSVERTQEARVLEVGRQMRVAAIDGGEGLHALLIPHINGAIRLQKPPLAYWLAAGSYGLFDGVANAWTGRLPFALASLATAAMTFLIGRRLFGGRAAFIACGACLGCISMARFGTLAETDGLATLFTTLAAWAFWLGLGGPNRRRLDAAPSARRAALYFNLGAIATGFAAMAKGPPAIFPVLFFVAFALVRRDVRALVRWVLNGAPLTFLLVAAPWYAYVIRTVGWTTFASELKVATEGGAHRGSFLSYFGYLVSDSAPWSLLTILAMVAAGHALLRRRGANRYRPPRDARIVGLLLWLASVLVPLCLIGQKQRHYLLPLVPPLMLIVAWYVDRALRIGTLTLGRGANAVTLRIALCATAVLALAAAIGLPLLGRHARGANHFAWPDAVASAAMLTLAIAIAGFAFGRGPRASIRAAIALAVFAPLAFVATRLLWDSSLNTGSPKIIAADVRRQFGQRPVRFTQPDDLPVQFHFRTQPAPTGGWHGRPLIIQTTDPRKPEPPPPGTVELTKFLDADDLVRICEPATRSVISAPESMTRPTTMPSGSR